MRAAAAELECEEAARLRDEVRRLEQYDLGLGSPGSAGSLVAGRSKSGRAGTSAKGMAKAKARSRRRGP
jgi:excinuclease ABC subunit B